MGKRLLVLLLLIALATPALAGEGRLPLSSGELSEWREGIWETLQALPALSEPLANPLGAQTYLVAYAFGMAELFGESVEAGENPVAGIEILTDTVAGPRGVMVGDPIESVLAYYPSDNPDFAGDRSYALLYLHEDGQEALAYGLLLRNGQTPECLQYGSAVRAGDGSDRWEHVSVSYVITDGYVSSFRVEGFGRAQQALEVAANLSSLREMAEEAEYVPVTLSESPFDAADLSFAGLSFISARQADCQSAFGEPLSYGVSGEMRVLVYADMVAECAMDTENGRLETLLVTGGEVEGPRGICVGDSIGSVVSRFGGDPASTLVYTCVDDAGNYYALRCTFFGGKLTEFMISRQ